MYLSRNSVSLLLSIQVLANKVPSKIPASKTSLPVKAAPETQEGVSRLRVEGGIKTFNLFIPSTQLSLLLNSQERKTSADIRQIIERDLAITGGFNIMTGSGVMQKNNNETLLKQKGAEGVSYLSLSFSRPLIRAVVEHKNFMTGQEAKQTFEGSVSQARRLAHQLAQSIYENYVGPEDIFLCQIAAIKKSKGSSQVVLLDFDGHNEISISSGISIKSAPYFAPDGKTILYTIVSDQGQEIAQ